MITLKTINQKEDRQKEKKRTDGANKKTNSKMVDLNLKISVINCL